MDSVVIILLQKVKKQVKGKLGIFSSIRDQRTKKSKETNERLKSCEATEFAHTCRYTSG